MMTVTEILTSPRRSADRPFTPATVRTVRRHGRHAASIDLAVPRSWPRHLPGQFVAVGVQIDGVWHERCFSLTGRPADRNPQITVQARPDGLVSRHLVERVTPGTPIRLSNPSGHFVLPERPGPLLFVTAGSGLTPVVGMLRTLSAASVPADLDVVWVHHARTAADLLFADQLALWGHQLPWLRVDLRLTREGARRLTVDQLDEVCPDWPERATYVCGPAELSSALGQHWADAGLDHRFVTESFRGVGATEDAGDTSGDATVLAARTDRLFDGHGGPTLLAAAEAAGLAPKSGCRMGICHTCATRLDAGRVRDVRDGRLHGAGSHIQLCVSAPAGDVTLDL